MPKCLGIEKVVEVRENQSAAKHQEVLSQHLSRELSNEWVSAADRHPEQVGLITQTEVQQCRKLF